MPSSGVQTCARSEEHTSELQSHDNLVCRLLLEKKQQPQRGGQPTAPPQPRDSRRRPWPHTQVGGILVHRGVRNALRVGMTPLEVFFFTTGGPPSFTSVAPRAGKEC